MPNGEVLGSRFTIDISDLKAGLAQANRLIRESESEFLSAAAGMEDWEDSAEGLQKRVKTLSDQFDIQQTKVAALVAEKERIIDTMKAEGKSNEEIERAVDSVNKSIQREGKQLDTIKKKLKQSEKNLDSFASAADDTADAMGDMSDEAADMRDATSKLTDDIADQKKRLEELRRAYSNTVLEQGESSDAAKELKKEIAGLSKELKTSEKRLKDTTEGLEDLNEEAKESEGGFTVAKGAVAGFVAGGLMALVGAAGNAVSSLLDIAESTRETRTNMSKLNTSFASAGKNAKSAQKSFKSLYGVLGDEGKATEAASHFAELARSEEDLTDLTTISAGVFAKWGESLPVEQLAETANLAAKTGDVSGGLADSLDWVTLGTEGWRKALSGNNKALEAFRRESRNGATNSEAFAAALAACSTEQERQELIMDTLNVAYGEIGETYKQNNAAVIEAQEATSSYNTAMANLGGEVEPLSTAFTNLKTTLIEAVTPAVGGLADVTADLITNLITADEETDLLSESQRAAVTAAEESAAAYHKNKEAADEMADAQFANLGYGEQLLTQLTNLVDENGKVKAGEEERAQFIMGQLNEALGTEYTKLSQIVDANGQIKDSVYDVIEAKKAQILMEAYEETYRQAVLNVAEAEKARAIQAQELAAQEKVASDARIAADQAEAEWAQKKADAKTEADFRAVESEARTVASLGIEARKQEGILEDKQAAYNETEDTLFEYYRDIEGYETANTLMLEGETDKAIKQLDKLGDGYVSAASTAELAADEQYKVLEQQVIDTEVNAQLMKEAYENGVEGVSEEMVKTAKEQADAAKEEFHKVGGEITKGIAEGAEEEEWTLTGALKSLVSKAVTAAKKAAGIESPSKLFKQEVGRWIGRGVAVGVDDSTKDVVKSIDNQVNAALKAYDVGKINDAISGGVNVSTGGKIGAEGLASGSNGNPTGGVTVYQTNHYSQAHSRYELYKTEQATAAAVRLALGGA